MSISGKLTASVFMKVALQMHHNVQWCIKNVMNCGSTLTMQSLRPFKGIISRRGKKRIIKLWVVTLGCMCCS